MESTRQLFNRMGVRTLLVFWLMLLSAVAFLDRTNLSIAGVQIGREFNVDPVHLGWIFSSFLAGYTIFQIAGGWLAVRLGPRRVLAAGVCWWGIFTAATALVPPGFAHSLALLIAVRFALGAGEAIVYPASNQFVARWIPISERGMANGIIFSGVGVGSGLTPMLLTALIAHYGWRASFWFSAALGIAAGAVWFACATDAPEQHRRISARELEHIRSGLPAEAPRRNVKANPLPWMRLLRNVNILALTFSYFFFGYVAWIFFSWFFLYMARVRGLDLRLSSIFTMFPFIAMTVCCIAGGWLSDRLVRRYGPRLGRCGLGMVSLLLTALFLVLGSQAASAQTAGVILAGGAGALYLAQSCFWSVTADIAGPHSGIVAGVMNMGAQAGGAVTATLTPLIALHFGWPTSFAVAAALALCGALAWLAVHPADRLLPAEPSSAAGHEIRAQETA